MFEQLPNRSRHGVPVRRVGIHVAGDDEMRIVRETALKARVVVDVLRTGDVVGPEPDLVGIASPVPVFRPVEDRRSGVADEKVDDRSADAHGHVPMALGGQAQPLQRFLGVEGRAVGVGREPGSGHVFPAKRAERTHLLDGDLVLRQHGHAVLSLEHAETMGIPGQLDSACLAARGAIAVEVKAGRQAGRADLCCMAF